MKRFLDIKKAISIMTFAVLLSGASYGSEKLHASESIIIAAKQSKCSAPGVDDFEGTDMSGVTSKCKATFDACVDASVPCGIRKQKCAEFDKMDRNGSCYKKGSS
jgi:hypothetical protein